MYFTMDRFTKYALGSIRLLLVAVACAWWANICTPYTYFLVFPLLGMYGAASNTNTICTQTQILLLFPAVSVCWLLIPDTHVVIAWIFKTMAGDLIASKLDTLFWKLVLAVVTIFTFVTGLYIHAFVLFLVCIQALNELGDQYLEQWTFFRHRYAYEVSCLVLFATWSRWTQFEQSILVADVLSCLGYRVGNTLLFIGAADDRTIIYMLAWILNRLRGQGGQVHVVTDAAVAERVLASSVDKGNGMERWFAQYAWLPSYSVESEDGPRWARMAAVVHLIKRQLPRMDRVRDEVAAVCLAVLHGLPDQAITAQTVTECVVRSMVRLLFCHEMTAAEVVLACAARDDWANMLTLRSSVPDGYVRQRFWTFVRVLVLQDAHWSNMIPAGMCHTEYISAFFQPYIMSPMINVCDMMSSIEAIRSENKTLSTPFLIQASLQPTHHPFPIMERVLQSDIGHMSSGDQVYILHTYLGAGSKIAFGAGKRRCPGQQLAITLVDEMLLVFVASAHAFRPSIGHRFSGRTNDTKGVLSDIYRVGHICRRMFFM